MRDAQLPQSMHILQTWGGGGKSLEIWDVFGPKHSPKGYLNFNSPPNSFFPEKQCRLKKKKKKNPSQGNEENNKTITNVMSDEKL